MIYLASPYSHAKLSVRCYRFKQAAQAAGLLMSQGLHVFSPICHSHPIVTECPEHGGDWSYWEKWDRHFLKACDRFVILQIDGWATSKGVTAEIEIAKEFGLKVEYMNSPTSDILPRPLCGTCGGDGVIGYGPDEPPEDCGECYGTGWADVAAEDFGLAPDGRDV